MVYTYRIGKAPDHAFIEKLKLLLTKAYQYGWRGYGKCRIINRCHGETELSKSVDYYVALHDVKIVLVVCGAWEHYAVLHNVQPDPESREIVLRANVSEAGPGIDVAKEGWHEKIVNNWRRTYKTVEVLYVEKFTE